MINKQDTAWYCIGCKTPTSTLHEIFFGSLRRNQSIEYNIQVPACVKCHVKFHAHKIPMQEKLCASMSFPERHLINQALQNKDTEYLEAVARIGELMLQRMEV